MPRLKQKKTASKMKTKSYFIIFFIFLLAISLLCLSLQFLQLHKTVELKLKRNQKFWRNQFLSSFESDDGLATEELEELDIFDMQLKKIKIIGRIKATDDFRFYKDGLASLEENARSQTIGDVEQFENVEWTTTPDKNIAENKKNPQEKSSKNAENEQINLEKSQFNEENLKQEMVKSPETKREMVPGFINLYMWDYVCGNNIESLKEFVLFPSLPKYKKLLNQTAVQNLTTKNIGIRLFGHLKPKRTGLYQFGVSSRGHSELWLSKDTNSQNKRRIAYLNREEKKRISPKRGDFQQFSTHISEKIYLEKEKEYYFEFLYKHASQTGWFEVSWMTPLSTTFQVIPGKLFSAFSSAGSVTKSFKSGGVTEQSEQYKDIRVQMSNTRYNSMIFMDFMDFEKAFPVCDYEPSYYVTEKLVRFQVIMNGNGNDGSDNGGDDGNDGGDDSNDDADWR